jgi:spore maturation protein CgeB
MKLVIFGLTVSSSWGNGHATLWRALCKALSGRGHQVTFFERNVPYYEAHRDLTELPGGRLVLYSDWSAVRQQAKAELLDADVAMVTSYCPDGRRACELVLDATSGLRVFYDLDTPVTLSQLQAGHMPDYIPPDGLAPFDLVLSYTGGQALELLSTLLGARRVAALYGHVDPDTHRPVTPVETYRADLSYLGTYAADRQATLEQLLIEPARVRPRLRFSIGGAQYPEAFPWTSNIFFVHHLPPAEHPAFFCSSRLTLNVTRQAMARMGYCPSGRLFEAAACGVPLLSDWWPGLDEFFTPGSELFVARSTEDVLATLDLSSEELARVAARARERTLDQHTAESRARELERLLERTSAPAETAGAIETVSN